MPGGERLLNIAVGLSVISWGVMGLIEGRSEQQLGTVRISIAALNFLVGTLFLLRCPVIANASLRQIAICLPSIAIALWAFAATSPLNEWPVYAMVIFAFGTGLAIISFLKLGRNFAVLPALRGEIVTGGAYRFMRHPAYTGELVMIAACGLAAWRIGAVLPFVFAVPLVMARVVAEEQLLRKDPNYATYAEKVKWRLLPGVW